MPIIFGTRWMGKVDAVSGVGHVATKFFHVQFVPLIPVESYLIFREVGEQVYGVKIPFSPKSILVAWFRTACIVAAIGLGLAGFMHLSKHHVPQGLVAVVLSILAVGTFIGTYYLGLITKASYNRAMYLAQRAGSGPEQILALEIAYGRMNADQADRELARLYEEAQQAHERKLAEPPPGPEQFVFK